MPTYITGSSNYPYNLDLLPTGTTDPTISYVLDEIRDDNGVVTQSGNTITAVELNATYTIIDKLETVLGYNPAGSYSDVASRLNDMQFSGSNAFLHLSGGSITGFVDFVSGSTLNVTKLNGNSLTVTLSGTTNIYGSGNIGVVSTGNLSIAVANASLTGTSVTVSADNLILSGGASSTLSAGSNIISMSPTGTLINQNIVPQTGSSIDLGSATSHINNLYVNNIITTGSNTINGYVPKSGSDFYGILTFTGTAGLVLGTGVNISTAGSGINNMGSLNNPMGEVYTKTLYATNVTGMSPINFLSDISLSGNITTQQPGTTIGSVSNPINTLYVTNIVGATGLDATKLVQRSGSDMFGNLSVTGNANVMLGSGSNVVPIQSGTSQIGTTGSYMSNVYTNSINNRSVGSMVFGELMTGTTDGINRTFWFSRQPASNYAMVFVSGLYVIPAVDFIFSGSAIIFTGSFAAPTTPPYAGFYVY